MRVLIIDTDKDFKTEYILELKEDFVVDIGKEIEEVTYLLDINKYDAIIATSSFQLLDSYASEKSCPILVFADLPPSVAAIFLEYWADIIVPANTTARQLKYQIRAIIRASKTTNRLSFAKNLSVNHETKSLYVGAREVSLRKKEFEIFEYLMMHRNRLVSKEEILEHIWEDGFELISNSVEVHIRNLRRKLEISKAPLEISTRRGFGYIIKV
jgi:DNA-binding response OmpR family regulator